MSSLLFLIKASCTVTVVASSPNISSYMTRAPIYFLSVLLVSWLPHTNTYVEHATVGPRTRIQVAVCSRESFLADDLTFRKMVVWPK
jgi:hypothetical protein